ncbi:ComEC/Rec2 family competence protein [Inconstantimicrobium mannanitabidum]|uniref:Metallo beta-lactamase superfamily lipoprotein n=1 Tax=Inconstantimicrobium mannanitabidum TaxID=1604901 RepID=A0ACB5RCK3_9CLOT|nr:ComEC/Rec2 family competence protein [Clostridium sp. TW13]GKX66778.1 metallo beta-lactamase superfamily lipoprotein [Clostridium sp. TW13]
MKKIFSYFLSIAIIFTCITLTSCSKSADSSIDNLTETSALRIHYIDVGQGDAILIQVNHKNFLIDSGPSDSQSKILGYLKNLHINKFDYILATHPHEDHIGNMTAIIKKYDITTFLAPKVTTNTSTFKNMLLALKNKNMHINAIKAGSKVINLGENITVEVLSPNNSSYEELNNYSPMIKLTYGSRSFLFVGDAQKEVEQEVLSKNYDVKADVLKVGHHGSSTSTSNEFLKKVNPSIAVISVGANNSYKHPNKSVIDRLKESSIKIYRTDNDGNIIIDCDGKNIKVTTK